MSRSSNVDEQTSKGLSPEPRSLHSRLQFAYQFKMLRTESMKKAELNGSDESFCSVVFLLLLLLVCMRPPEAVKSWRRRPHFPLYLFPLSHSTRARGHVCCKPYSKSWRKKVFFTVKWPSWPCWHMTLEVGKLPPPVRSVWKWLKMSHLKFFYIGISHQFLYY